jgi:hypothetical protein
MAELEPNTDCSHINSINYIESDSQFYQIQRIEPNYNRTPKAKPNHNVTSDHGPDFGNKPPETITI